jgi:hypothetical protein
MMQAVGRPESSSANERADPLVAPVSTPAEQAASRAKFDLQRIIAPAPTILCHRRQY